MAAVKSRASLMAVTVEATAGTYVAPSASTDFIALQEGFSLQPNFEVLENAELRAGIGVAQPIQGLEQPTGSMDHYLRHSGVEGTPPNYALLLKSLMGAQTANATQRVTDVGSSVSAVVLAAGGSDFARGFGIMSKTSTYEMRPVHSVSDQTLTLGFNLLNAPGTGIGMGKCVNWSPANEGHPTLSLTLYRGNGGAVEVLTGARIGSAAFKVAAGQLINASYQFQGVKYHFDPILITAYNKYIDFTNDDETESACAITEGFYRDPHELAAAVTSAMNAASPGETALCVYLDASGKFKITSTGTVLSLLWKTGAHGSDNSDKHAGTVLGFSDAADSSGTAAATGYTSASAISLVAARTVYPSLVVTASNKYIDFTNDDETESACAVAEGTYTSPYQLADAIAAAMNAASPGETHTVNFNNSTNKFTIKATGTVLTLLWKTGVHGSDNTDTHIGTLIGFSDAANKSGTVATTGYASDTAISSSTLAASYDNADPQAAKNNEILIGDSTNTTCFCASTIDFSVTNEIQAVECICAESGIQEYLITKRTVEAKVVGLLSPYDVDQFKRYRSNADVRACMNFGSKAGGNWVPGQCMMLYIPVAKVSAFALGDKNGIVTAEITISPYMDSSGNGEFYINAL